MLRFTTIILSLTFLTQWSEADEDVKVDELESSPDYSIQN